MKRIVVVFVAVVAAIGSTLIAATPASASPTCNTADVWLNNSNYYAEVPAYWSGSGDVSLACNMVRGNVSNGVLVLQRTLNDCYLEPAGQPLLSEDRNFGRLTFEALKYAQGRAGARVDGVYGPETLRKLNWSAGQPGTCDRLFF